MGRPTLDADGTDAELPDQFAAAHSETAEPTAEAIGDLICEALKNAGIPSVDLEGAESIAARRARAGTQCWC